MTVTAKQEPQPQNADSAQAGARRGLSARALWNRIALVVLMAWGIVMIAPDLVRIAEPLGSFGFYANNDGLIYDVLGAFEEEAQSPAWQAGIRPGDRLDLARMKCDLGKPASCQNALALLGGVEFVFPGWKATLHIKPADGSPEREVTLVATQRPSNFLIRTINMLCQIAGIAVVLASGWLAWTRPSRMSWGFFLYANWFNPGQVYAFYAMLLEWPLALFLQNFAASIAEGVGYAGLLLFVLRVPNDKTESRWLPLQRMLPLVAIAYSVLVLSTYGSLFGFPTETITRVEILAGFIVVFAAVTILLIRRRSQTPEDYQRVRWVLWGCLIGLPAFLIAELASWTTIFVTRFGDFTPTEDIVGLLYLVNGIFCLFVVEALRRPRVVSVTIPLRRVTVLGLSLSLPVLFLHRWAEQIEEQLDLPVWAWLVFGAAAVFLISRLHEGAVHVAEEYFSRGLKEAERRLREAVRGAKHVTDIDRALADEAQEALQLSSAAAFRRRGKSYFRDENGAGWEDAATRTLRPGGKLLAPLASGKPFDLLEPGCDDGLDLPSGLRRPILAVPASNPIRCFAVSLYGPHKSGTDLDANERAMLARLAGDAAAMYAEIEAAELRRKVESLESEIKSTRKTPGGEQRT